MERCPKNHEDCSEYDKKLGCVAISHHIFYPGNQYTTPLERTFRGLQRNRVDMCRAEEVQLHENYPFGPPKPSEEIMHFCVEQDELRRRLHVRED